MTSKVATDCVVIFNYTLHDQDQNLLDSSDVNGPLAFLCGGNNILPALEQSLLGKEQGDKFHITIKSSQAYGERSDLLFKVVPKSYFDFPENISIGDQFELDFPAGKVLASITEIREREVVLDGNHPLAGKDLKFYIDIIEIRTASEEELARFRRPNFGKK